MDRNVKKLDPAEREKLMKSAVRLDSVSQKELSAEILERVTGGNTVEWGTCRRCGGQLYASFGEHMVIFAPAALIRKYALNRAKSQTAVCRPLWAADFYFPAALRRWPLRFRADAQLTG